VHAGDGVPHSLGPGVGGRAIGRVSRLHPSGAAALLLCDAQDAVAEVLHHLAILPAVGGSGRCGHTREHDAVDDGQLLTAGALTARSRSGQVGDALEVADPLSPDFARLSSLVQGFWRSWHASFNLWLVCWRRLYRRCDQ
jgi:hypothetical protein